MATNPNYRPPDRNDQTGSGMRPEPQIVEQIERRSRFPWPLIALIVAGTILAIIIYALPRTPRAAPGPTAGQVPDQPFAGQLQMKDLRLSESPIGGQTYVYGEIQNTGSNAIGQVTVDAAFTDAQGHPLQRETRNIEFLNGDKGAPEVVTTALKPGATTPFRVGFDALPAGWNHQVPQMRIVHVTAPGQPGIPAGDTSGTGTTGAQGSTNPPQTPQAGGQSSAKPPQNPPQ